MIIECMIVIVVNSETACHAMAYSEQCTVFPEARKPIDPGGGFVSGNAP